MATKVVKVRLHGTHMAVGRLGRQVADGVRDSCRETAQFGLTVVERQIRKAKPKPVATNTYRLAWSVKNTKDGAVLGNSAKHAVFVEVGRRPGKPPPVGAIRDWVLAKRIVRPYRPRAPKPPKSELTPKQAAARDAARQRRYAKAAGSRMAQATGVAARIAKAIGRRGIKGRYILAKSMPPMQRMLNRELARRMRQVVLSHKG